METTEDFANKLDFIENLLLTEEEAVKSGQAPSPSLSGEKMAPAGIDITNTVVPDELMSAILGKEHKTKVVSAPKVQIAEEVEEPTVVEEEEVAAPSVMITEETAQALIPLMQNLATLIKEMTGAMTSSGSTGTNFACPQEDIYKRPTTKKKSRKGILKDSIRSKLAK